MNNNNIGKAIERYLITSRLREEDPFKKKKFYVSDMGKCHRMRFLKRKGITSEYDNFVYWTFQLGDLIHDFGYKALEAQGLLLATEEYVNIGEHFTGRYDGKLSNGNDLPTIFDFKSANPWKLMKIEQGGDTDEENAMQVMTYVKFILKEKPGSISEIGTVVYINKEPSEKTTTTIAYSKDFHLSLWESKIDEDMNKMIKYWELDVLPPCTCPGWMKAYNSFQPLCESDEPIIRGYLKAIKDGKKVVCTKKGVEIKDN